MVNKRRRGCYKTPSTPIRGLKCPQLRPQQMPEIKHRANTLGLRASKKWLLFQCRALADSAHGKLAAVLDLPPIIYSHSFPPCGFISSPDMMHHFPSAPSLTMRRRQIKVLTWIHTWRVYTAECTGHPCLQRGCYWRPSPHTAFQLQPRRAKGRKDDASYVTNTPGLTLIGEHFNAARLIPRLASSRKKQKTHTHTEAKIKSELISFELHLISEITRTAQNDSTHLFHQLRLPLCLTHTHTPVCGARVWAPCNLKHYFFDIPGEATLNNKYLTTTAFHSLSVKQK